jgi:hypothetical protein
VPEEDDRARPPLSGPRLPDERAALGQQVLDVVEELGEGVHVTGPPTGAAVAPQVERQHVDAAGGECVANLFVAAGVLVDAVHQQQRGPERATGGPPPPQELLEPAAGAPGLGGAGHGAGNVPPSGSRNTRAAVWRYE